MYCIAGYGASVMSKDDLKKRIIKTIAGVNAQPVMKWRALLDLPAPKNLPLPYSPLMPAARMTGAHLADSAVIKADAVSGVVGSTGPNPRSANVFCTSGLARF